MGIAMVFIMFCHLDVAQTQNGITNTALARYLHTFTVGVDIFLFLSGVGWYYSYTKRPQTYAEFEKKRVLRVLPSYLIIGSITYFLFDIVMNHFTIGRFLSDILFISWFRAGSTKYWYILAISIFYLFFPMTYRIIQTGNNLFQETIIFSAIWWLFIEILCNLISELSVFRIALDRFPIFVIGAYFGKLSYEKKEISKKAALFLLFSGILIFSGFKISVLRPLLGRFYYPVRAVLGLSVISFVIIIMELAEKKWKWFYTIIMVVFGWLGQYTLELYLLHQSYMIVFNYPYSFATYVVVAFILPIITTGAICICRKRIKRITIWRFIVSLMI